MISVKKNSNLRSVTTRPGVYKMFNGFGKVLYVGKAVNLKKRLSSYFSSRVKDTKTQALLKHVVSIDVIVTRTENEAFIVENNLIKSLLPKYNILFRDDKSYPYIQISSENYPRIGLCRGKKILKDSYFGPYPCAGSAHKTIHLIQKLFQIRMCKNSFFRCRNRPCLQYQIKRCSAPCMSYISKENYSQDIENVIKFLKGRLSCNEIISSMEEAARNLDYELAAKYRDQIKYLREIQAEQCVDTKYGDIDVIVVVIECERFCVDLLMIRGGCVLGNKTFIQKLRVNKSSSEIIATFMLQYYLLSKNQLPSEIILDRKIKTGIILEKILTQNAAKTINVYSGTKGKKKQWIKMATINAQIALLMKANKIRFSERQIIALKKELNLPKLPSKIVCFDISHMHGESTIGACVFFDQNGAKKSSYRQFAIYGVKACDDFAAMHQVIYRYFLGLKNEDLPDVVVVDGGKGQISYAKNVIDALDFNKNIILIGVAKDKSRRSGFEKIYLTGESKPVCLHGDSLALRLLLQIRDEAHRFAITCHRKKIKNKMKNSILDVVSGVGEKRKRELLKSFGGLQGLLGASIEELQSVNGIGANLAKQIYESLH